MFNIVNEAKYFTEGKITIEGGGYSLLDNLDIEVREIKDGEDITLPIYQTAESLGDSYNEFGICREMTHPHSEFYEWMISFADETAEKLRGKKFSWTFPGELSKFNGSGTFPEYMPITKMLSPEGFFPCLELVMEGSKVTAIKYHIARSPDIEAEYVPEVLCYFDGVGIFDHSGSFQGLEEDLWDNFNPAHSGILTLEKPVEYSEIDSVQSYFRVYPNVKNSKEAFDEWLNTGGNDFNDNAKFIRYGWHCRTDFPETRAVLIRDNDFSNMSGNIADALSANAENVNNVMHDDLRDESKVTDTVKAQIENDDIEVLGGFKGIEVQDAGNYATKINVLFNSELLDKLQGIASSDIHVFPIAHEEATTAAVRTRVNSGLVRLAAASTQPKGQLLNEEGKALDTINTKKFIVALSLPKANYYDIYVARNKPKPQTPEEPKEPEEPAVEEPAKSPDKEPVIDEPEKSPDKEPVVEEPIKEPVTGMPVEEPVIDSPDTIPNGGGNYNDDDSQYSEYADQKIDSGIIESIANLIGSDYEVFSFYDALKAGMFKKFNNNVTVNRRNFTAISDDLDGAELVGVLPAFTLDIKEPIILVMNVSADKANQQELHFYPMKGANVAGASYNQLVRLSAKPDTSEDTSAIFFDSDGKTRITKLTAKNIFVAAGFTSGSYAPLVLTGTAKSKSEPEPESETETRPEDNKEDGQDNNNVDDTSDSILGSSSGGCHSGLFASGALVLALLVFRKRA